MFGRGRLAFCFSLLRKLILGSLPRRAIFHGTPYWIKWKACFLGARGFTLKVDPGRPCHRKNNIHQKRLNCDMQFACACACFSYFSMPFWVPKRGRKVVETCTGASETHVAISRFFGNVDFPLAGPVRIDFMSGSVRTRKGCFSFNSMTNAIENECSQGGPRNEFS